MDTEIITVYVGLGSNLGDRAGNLLLAVRGLMEASFVVNKLSGIYETEPVGIETDMKFLNMVAEIHGTNVSPSQMMARLLRIEYLLGRTDKSLKKPRTVEEVLTARMVSYPFTVRDICLVTDGGGAIVLTTPERAKSLKKPPVYVLGQGQAITHANISSMPDLTVTGALESGRQAYAMAGLGPKDIDVLELYDAFTINTILFLEDLGLCPKGEGGPFVEGGRIAPGGELPVNTNGGGLSYCHPGMYGLFLLIEAVRQLRGECGERQVAGAETAIAHGNGGVLSSQSTVILGTAATV